jgi:selenocysteine-specific elongation factor
VAAVLERTHREQPGIKGVGLERLRLQVEPRLPVSAFLPFLQRLAKRGDIVVDGAVVRLARHEAKLSAEDQKTWSRIVPLLSDTARFRPPRTNEIAAALSLREAEVRRLLKQLAKMAAVDEIAPDHFFLRETVAEMVDIVADLSAKGSGGQFSAADFRDRLDNGRKVAIQILEFFDRHSVTARHGDLRRINDARRDLYRRGSPAATS